jgi:hypothetical protein
MQKWLTERKLNETSLDPREVASAIGGEATGSNVMAPGPGHSRIDRSLSIKIDSTALDGFIVHSFAGDSPFVCREYVRAALGLNVQETRGKQSSRQRSCGALQLRTINRPSV